MDMAKDDHMARLHLAECSHGKRESLGSSPDRDTIFSSPVTFGGQCGFAARATKGNTIPRNHRNLPKSPLKTPKSPLKTLKSP